MESDGDKIPGELTGRFPHEEFLERLLDFLGSGSVTGRADVDIEIGLRHSRPPIR